VATEGQDQSHLDRKYFVDQYKYNCPFCNRRHVSYRIDEHFMFNWTTTKQCFVYLVQCSSCVHRSMHLSYEFLLGRDAYVREDSHEPLRFETEADIDSKIFYSVPTSFFVMDERIPRVIRELVSEADVFSHPYRPASW
jgi:transcription elongation factor Elf1